jgi:hypothetical protein
MTLLEKMMSSKVVEAPLFSAANQKETRRANAWLTDRIHRAEREGVFSEVIELTPVIAELLLARNPSNRTMSETKLSEYARDIGNGSWELNGEPIIISEDGLLNDGQHRCTATVRSGRSIRTVITFGVRRESRVTVDQGSARTAGDYLAMDGIESSREAAAVAGMIWQYETIGKVSRESDLRPTKAQVRECFFSHEGINDSIRAATHHGVTLVGGKSTLGFCHFVFKKKNATAADYFIQRLIRGDGLAATDPIYRCRERLHSNRKMDVHQKVELIFRTWNAFRRGKKFDGKSSPTTGVLPDLEK